MQARQSRNATSTITRSTAQQLSAVLLVIVLVAFLDCWHSTDGCNLWRTQFVLLASDKSKAVTHKPPSVGLQNTNKTCYMNSFVQGLFLMDAFFWRIYNFNLKLKNNPSKISWGRLWIRKEGGGASPKAIRKDGPHKAQTHRYLGYLAGIPCRLSMCKAAGFLKSAGNARMWQRLCALSSTLSRTKRIVSVTSWRKWSAIAQGGLCRSAPWLCHLMELTCKDISEMSEFGRKPLQISCYKYLQPRKSKRRAACQQCKSSWRKFK